MAGAVHVLRQAHGLLHQQFSLVEEGLLGRVYFILFVFITFANSLLTTQDLLACLNTSMVSLGGMEEVSSFTACNGNKYFTEGLEIKHKNKDANNKIIYI